MKIIMKNSDRPRRALALGILAGLALTVGVSAAALGAAGLNNQAYSFGRIGGAPTIGIGGAQAIIGSQVFNVRPENILRGPDGSLYTVIQGPGHSALVFDSAGRLVVGIPGASPFSAYRISPWTYPALYGSDAGDVGMLTSTTLTSWTSMVGGAAPGTYLYPTGQSAIDMWIAQVFAFPGR